MSADTVALIVAIVGVVGTLASALLTQVLSLHAKHAALDDLRQQRLEDRTEERRRAEHGDRRDSCIAVNMTARRFRQALKNFLYEGTDESARDLEQARQEFTSRYGEAQMILPYTVLKEASTANGCLADAYGMVKAGRRPGEHPPQATEMAKIEGFLDKIVGFALKQLRQAMRVDLGVAD